MWLQAQGELEYPERGFFIIQTGKVLANRLMALRTEALQLFRGAHGRDQPWDEWHSAPDAHVVEMYRGPNRDLWVAAYDQLRYMPEVYALCAERLFLSAASTAKIERPQMAARPIVRCDMPDDPEHEFDQHQDYVYNWGSRNSITIWIPLQDTPAEMGALKIVPGSHKRGVLPSTETGHLAHPYPEDDFITVPVRLGEALVFSQLLVHRSGHNTTDRCRFSIQLRYNDLADPHYIERKWYINERIEPKRRQAETVAA